MTEKITTWLVDATGTYALVEGAEARNGFLALGWKPADEPGAGDFLYCRHPDVEASARMTAETLEVFAGRGWEPAPPPEPESPFNAEPPPALPAEESTPVPDKPKKAAASGEPKEN